MKTNLKKLVSLLSDQELVSKADYLRFCDQHLNHSTDMPIVRELVSFAISTNNEDLLEVGNGIARSLLDKINIDYLHCQHNIAQQYWFEGHQDGIVYFPGLDLENTLATMSRIAIGSLEQSDDPLPAFRKCINVVCQIASDSPWLHESCVSILQNLTTVLDDDASSFVRAKLDKLTA